MAQTCVPPEAVAKAIQIADANFWFDAALTLYIKTDHSLTAWLWEGAAGLFCFAGSYT